MTYFLDILAQSKSSIVLTVQFSVTPIKNTCTELNTSILWKLPHELKLKIAANAMLLENIDIKNDLWNRTRPSVGGIHNRILEVTILTDNIQSQRELILKMDLINSDTVPTFLSLRYQSPVCHSCAMVINKAQGQIIKSGIRVYVPDSGFAYGQLYIAFSRAHAFGHILPFVRETATQQQHRSNTFTKNIFDHIIYLPPSRK